jgi:hypothetical protein
VARPSQDAAQSEIVWLVEIGFAQAFQVTDQTGWVLHLTAERVK